MNTKKEIFEAFRRNIINKICPYLSEFNFTSEDAIKEESEWINAKFKQNETIIDFCVSLHHLDYADGIVVILKSTRGIKNLINEASINNSKVSSGLQNVVLKSEPSSELLVKVCNLRCMKGRSHAILIIPDDIRCFRGA